jgi:RNA polymerase sigma factor (sigma-70 family)
MPPVPAPPNPDTGSAAFAAQVAAIWRAEAAAVVATTARLVRDVALAEDIAQDALLAAWQHWPVDGLPERPGAWLTTTAQRKALDHLRRHQMLARHHEALEADLNALQAGVQPDFVDGLDARRSDTLGDDVLRLMCCACHPVLSPEAQVALCLKLVAGLSTAEIARATLYSEPTAAQRLVRAKRRLSQLQPEFELPAGAAWQQRLQPVMTVLYLMFNEGHTATAGEDWMRPLLCQEALRLARLLASLVPAQNRAHAEVQGLLALLSLTAARLPARLDGQGRPVLLAQQDRSRWDMALVQEGLAALAQAGLQRAGAPAGACELQAAIAACHARAADVPSTDWAQITTLYQQLLQVQPTPMVALNHAVALGQARGPDAALPLVQALAEDPALRGHHLLHAVMGDLLLQLGQRHAARQAFTEAAALTRNAQEHALMLQRAATATQAPPADGA